MRPAILFPVIGALILTVALAACNGGSSKGSSTESQTASTESADSSSTSAADTEIAAPALATHESPEDYVWESRNVVEIVLNGNTATVHGVGATVSGATVTVTVGGVYRVTGTLDDGQLVVDAEDGETVQLILAGISIRSSTSAPFFVKSASKTVLILEDGTRNTLTDALTYVFPDPEEDEPNAALFSKDDLSISGTGDLLVHGRYNDGISSKDGLIIAGGRISVQAADDGIRGKDYLVVKGGDITVQAGGDGLKSDNEEDTDCGIISVEAGSFDIQAGGDGLQAFSTLSISGGSVDVTTAGGSSGKIADSASAKGLKAGSTIVISGGDFSIQSADDALHANAEIGITGGTFALASGDDGIHADTRILISGGDFNITKSYEGIESASIVLNGGNFRIVSSDDGINIAGGMDGSSLNRPPGPPQGGFTTSTGDSLKIHGGSVVIYADGDGIDVNGAMEMSGGTVLVHGPTSDRDSAVDYDASFTISGGLLAAAGSAGMAMGPDRSSLQKSTLLNFSTRPAGTLIHIQDKSGQSLLTFAPARAYASLAFSSPDLAAGASYEVYFGGSATGSEKDGLYTGGSYTAGTQAGSFTVSE